MKVQTRSLIRIKCSWLDWVKQKQQQADWREALFTPTSSPSSDIPLKRGCFPPMRSNTRSLLSRVLFCFSRKAASLSLFLLIRPESWCFQLAHSRKSLVWQTAAFSPGAFGARQEKKSTWRPTLERRTNTDTAEHKPLKANSTGCRDRKPKLLLVIMNPDLYV